MELKNDLEIDVVVCGAGSSGLVAGLTARYSGANVILFEKLGAAGGTSVFAEGLFGVESTLQSEKKIGVTKNDMFKKHMEYSHWRANARLARVFIDKSGNTIDWLEQQGVEFEGPTEYFPNGPQVFHWIKGGGGKLIKVLSERAKENKIPIHYETPVQQLIRNKDGAITGVVVKDKKGNHIRVHAKAVIISTGDFVDNREMLEKYTESGAKAINRINGMDRTGDGIRMAWEVGAAPEGTNVLLASPWVPGEQRGSYLKVIAAKPLLWINEEGERFCAEDLYFPFAGNVLAKQQNGIMWVIFDEDTKDSMLKTGLRFRLGAFASADAKRFSDEIERGIKEGKAAVANSLEELAGKIGVNDRVFRATIDEYNQCCRQHGDHIFAKDPNWLQPIEKARFYAIKSCFHLTATLGGIKINHKTETITINHGVIPGLYAVGSCAGGLYGDSYDVSNTTGGALGFAVNSGRIAGENALEYINRMGN